MKCTPHYIRCIKPNDTKKARDWDNQRYGAFSCTNVVQNRWAWFSRAHVAHAAHVARTAHAAGLLRAPAFSPPA